MVYWDGVRVYAVLTNVKKSAARQVPAQHQRRTPTITIHIGGKVEDPIHIALPLICIVIVGILLHIHCNCICNCIVLYYCTVIVGILLHIHSPKHTVTERNAKATERIQKLRKYAKPIK